MKINKKNSIQSLLIIVIITLIAVPIYLSYAMPTDNLEEIQEEVSEDIIEEQSTEGQNANEQEFNASISEETESDNNFEANVNSDNETIDPSSEEDLGNDRDLKNAENESSENIVQNVSNNNQTGSEEKTDLEPKVTQDTSAEENANNSPNTTEQNTNYSLKATIYDSNQYETTTGTDLTESGIQIDNWEHSTSKYLLINPTVPDDGNIYTVTVKLPKEMYVVGTELIKPSGYNDVKFTPNEGIYINKDFTYGLDKLSGTVEYTMDYKTISGTIQLEIQYDYVLWDKQENSPITKEGVNPIEVILSKKGESVTELKKVVVNKVTSNLGISYLFLKQLSIDSISWTSFATNAKKTDTVGLYFCFLHPDQIIDYKYYESLTLTIKLPEYVDENGKKYYLEPDIEKFNLNEIQYNSYYLNKDELTNGILKLEYKKAYFSYDRSYLYFKPLNEELASLSQDEVVFQNGNIYCDIKGNSGMEYNNKYSSNIPKITYEVNGKEEVRCGSNSIGVTITDRPNESISFLGNFTLRNDGTQDSCQKEVYEEFDTDNIGLIKVTTINLFADTIQENIEVQYTLIDDDGNIVYFNSENGNVVASNSEGATNVWSCYLTNSNYNSDTQTNAMIKLNRENLPVSHQKYYFKSIKYNLKSIKAGAKLYDEQGFKRRNRCWEFFWICR